MREEILRLERVVCVEQGITQLDQFNLSIFKGEIMGLMTENNHGLSTLVRLLQHNLPLRSGYVYYREEQINSWRKDRPRYNRIGIIQTESCLVDGLTVADNIFVLRPGFKSHLMRPALLRRQLSAFLGEIGVEISAEAYVEELTDFQRVVVELLKAVVAGCKLVVLRDVGTHIPETELKKIYQIMRHYAAAGLSFLNIDFHFEELQQVCNRIAWLENGRIIKVLQDREMEPGIFWPCVEPFDTKVRRQLARSSERAGYRKPVFTAAGLTGETVHNLDFSVAAGECLVLQDVDNLVFTELLKMLTGQAPMGGGKLSLDGEPYFPRIGRELAVIQELPTESMLFPELSYLDNLCFTLDRSLPEIWRSTSVRRGIRMAWAPELGGEVFERRVDNLTELEKYELVYYRVALQKPKVVFCVQPFRRADVEMRMRIWELLRMLLERGIAVVILAVNLADSLSLADGLIRIRKDRPQEHYTRADFADIPISAPWLNVYREEKC